MAADGRRQLARASRTSFQDDRGPRVVESPRRLPGSASIRCARRTLCECSTKPASTPIGSFEPIQRRPGRRAGHPSRPAVVLEHLRPALDVTRGAVRRRRRSAAYARGAVRSRDPPRAGSSQPRSVEVLVLRREDVDRRRTNRDPDAVQPVRIELLAREDVVLGRADVRQQEVPGVADELVGDVDPDVASARQTYPARGSAHLCVSPAVCGSCSSTMSPGRSASASRARWRERRARRSRVSAARAARRRRAAVQRLWIRLVTAKKSVLPVDHRPARVDRWRRAYRPAATQHLRDAAAAPVELMHQIRRSPRTKAAWWLAASSTLHCPASRTSWKRAGGRAATWAAVSGVIAGGLGGRATERDRGDATRLTENSGQWFTVVCGPCRTCRRSISDRRAEVATRRRHGTAHDRVRAVENSSGRREQREQRPRTGGGRSSTCTGRIAAQRASELRAPWRSRSRASGPGSSRWTPPASRRAALTWLTAVARTVASHRGRGAAAGCASRATHRSGSRAGPRPTGGAPSLAGRDPSRHLQFLRDQRARGCGRRPRPSWSRVDWLNRRLDRGSVSVPPRHRECSTAHRHARPVACGYTSAC